MAAVSRKWQSITDRLDHAFQPIVNINNGACLGYECLLRDCKRAGFPSIQSVFDEAFKDGALHQVDMILREKAITKFLTYEGHEVRKLFYNLDNRLLDSPAYAPGATREILEGLGLSASSVCFEVSEKHAFDWPNTGGILGMYREQGYSIAIDDYGVGFSGLKRLYQCETDFIKIDGFFLSDIATSNRKRLFLSHIVGLAHVLGIKVVAEQVETKTQYYACKAAGCDFVQGYLIAEPTQEMTDLCDSYQIVVHLNREERRAQTNDGQIILEQIEFIEPLPLDATMQRVLEAFRHNPKYSFIPVVNALREPLGIIREPDIKEFVFSPYGRELMLNPAMRGRLAGLVTRCPVADVTLSLDKMLEVFSNAAGAELLMLVEGSRYCGFMSAAALLIALNEKNLAIARDQSPLTRLPGNSLITQYLADAVRFPEVDQMFVYFDLDNFKVFNDVYGFRQGDRAILLLADTLKEAAHGRNVFLGHIGGDDLFAGFAGPDWDVDDAYRWAKAVVDEFNPSVLSLFSREDRERGYLLAIDRSGVERQIPLLGVSCAVVALPTGSASLSPDGLGEVIAKCKKESKRAPDHISLFTFCTPSADRTEALTFS